MEVDDITAEGRLTIATIETTPTQIESLIERGDMLFAARPD